LNSTDKVKCFKTFSGLFSSLFNNKQSIWFNEASVILQWLEIHDERTPLYTVWKRVVETHIKL
jgi:hypothetical protein